MQAIKINNKMQLHVSASRLLTRRPYNLYCVGADVKPFSINQSINLVSKHLQHTDVRTLNKANLELNFAIITVFISLA